MKATHVLSIETSCDETASAIIQQNDGRITILSSVVSSQIKLHAQYGGVVPNLAAREHVRNIIPVLEEALKEAKISQNEIDAIAIAQGPGLIPALLIGVSSAKTLAYVWNKPLIGIHHIEGHIYANFINSEIKESETFPLLALVVSGGHTQLVLMKGHFQYEILGETRDDAAGEAFDKVARLLGLSYPGGPIISERAKKSAPPFNNLITLPRPMIHSPDFDFSFSGIKTAVLYLIKEHEKEKTNDDFINNVAREFQEAIVDVLVSKTKKAIEKYCPKTVIIAGGVSANERLRICLRNTIENNFPDTTFMMPEFKYSLDNAAMIGAAAAVRFSKLSPKEREALKNNSLALEPNANLALECSTHY